MAKKKKPKITSRRRTKQTKSVKNKPPQDKYSRTHIATVRMLVLECGMINSRGEIAWIKVAKYLKVTPRTIERWRDPSNKVLYKKAFTESLPDLQEEIDVGRVKRDTLTAARKHTLKKTIREPQITAPKPPRPSYRKQELIEYARDMLKPPLILTEKQSRAEMLLAVDRAIKKQAKRVMVVVRTISQEHMGNPAAQALVHANCGPEAERWIAKEGRVHEAGDSMGRLLEQLGDMPTVLPAQELNIGPKADDQEGIGKEHAEPVVAAESPLLDNGSNGPTD